MKYIAAVCAVIGIGLISYLALPVLGPGVMTLFGIAVLGCSFYFGLTAGLFVATAGVVINSYYFMPPVHSFQISRLADAAYVLLLFVFAFLANREGRSKQTIKQTLHARSAELDAVLTLVRPRFPVCSECGKFQTENSEWVSLADYLQRNYPTRQLSFCPDCLTSLHVRAQEDVTGDVA